MSSEARRVEVRQKWPAGVRITQLESDMDDNDNEIRKLRGSMDKLVWAVMGAVITFATSAVLLALNLGIGN